MIFVRFTKTAWPYCVMADGLLLDCGNDCHLPREKLSINRGQPLIHLLVIRTVMLIGVQPISTNFIIKG